MNISIRPWKIADLGNLVKFGNNFNIAKFLTDTYPFPYTEQDGINYITRVTSDSSKRIFAIAVNNEAIGSIGLFPLNDIFRKSAELGYWIAEPYWGKGIATKAIKLIVQDGFEHLDITRIFARPFGSNLASQKVLIKSGFVLEATFHQTIFKNGKFEDELVFAVRK